MAFSILMGDCRTTPDIIFWRFKVLEKEILVLFVKDRILEQLSLECEKSRVQWYLDH